MKRDWDKDFHSALIKDAERRGVIDSVNYYKDRTEKLKTLKFDKYKKPPSGKTEFHLPGYNYCGPGTDVEGRIRRGDRGVNYLDDQGCRLHDLDYMRYTRPDLLLDSDRRLTQIADHQGGIAGKAVSAWFKPLGVVSSGLSGGKFTKSIAGRLGGEEDPIKVKKIGMELYEKFVKPTII